MKEKFLRFIKNKNTVTIIGLILIIGILYFVYNNRIKTATQPVRVPVAKTTIQPKTKITDDMIEYISVPSVAVKKTTVTNKNNIVGKYSNYNTMIPEGSMFYNDTLITEAELPDAAKLGLKDGEILNTLEVNMKTSHYNSIMPGTTVDIYMSVYNDDRVLMVGRLLKDVSVLAVKSSDGLNVFENTDEKRTPAAIQFGSTKEIFELLNAASRLTAYNVTLFPAIPNTDGSSSVETTISTDELKEFINSHSIIPVENITDNNDPNVVIPNGNLNVDQNGNPIVEG